MKRFRKILIVLAVANSSIAYAQDDEIQYIERDVLGRQELSLDDNYNKKLVIAAGKSNKSVEKLPVTFYIISRDEIIRNGYVTLVDVLKMVPGMRVSQPHSGEYGEAFIQRGMVGNTYTKILLNGVELKPSGPKCMPLGADIPIRQAERIEIIYGPAAAAYGNDACGGVINIVTRQAEEREFTTADIIGGSGDYAYLNFQTGGMFGYGKNVAKFSLYGSNLNYRSMNIADYHKDDLYNPWRYFDQRGTTFEYNGQTINALDMTKETMFGIMMDPENPSRQELVAYLSRWENGESIYWPEMADFRQEATLIGTEISYRGITFTYNYMHRLDNSEMGWTPMLYSYNDPSTMMGEYINRFTLSGNWDFGNIKTNVAARYNRYRMDENSNMGVNWSDYTQYVYGASDDIGLDAEISWQLYKFLSINAGVSGLYAGVLPKTNYTRYKFDFDSYKSFASSVDYTDPVFGTYGINPYTYHQEGVYLQTDYDWKMLTITAGVRYDYNSVFGSSVNPRVAGIIQLTDKLTLRASRGYAYKAPTGTHIYNTVIVDAQEIYGLPMPYLAFHHVPNEDLLPEKIASTEFGLRYYINNNSYMELLAYSNRIRDPMVRGWLLLDTEVYKGSGTAMRPAYTRAYQNEKDAETKLRGYQFIGVFKDVYKPMHLNLSGSLVLSFGHENLSNDQITKEEAYANGQERFVKVDYVRGTPKALAQVAVDFNFLRIMYLRIDNVYCSKFARKYYMGTDDENFWAPAYYCLDLNLTMRIGNHIHAFCKVKNVTDAEYGGIDVEEMDVDLRYNPQLKRSFRFGLTYDF